MKSDAIALRVAVVLVIAFMLVPIFAPILTAFTTSAYILFPPQGFTLQWFANIKNYPALLDSLRTSAIIATTTTSFSLLLAVPSAFVIVRSRFRGRDLLNTFFASPLSVPWMVVAVALLIFYSQYIPLGPDTLAGLVAGQLVVMTPFMIRLIAPALTGLDRSLEEASMNLGAGRVRTSLRITLPLIRPAIISSAIFIFLLSFNDLTISLFLAGPDIQPFAVVLYTQLVLGVYNPTIAALVSVIIVAALCLTIVLSRIFKGYTASIKE